MQPEFHTFFLSRNYYVFHNQEYEDVWAHLYKGGCMRLYHLKRKKEKRVDISMMLICYASDVMGYDRRRSGLSNALVHMKQDANII